MKNIRYHADIVSQTLPGARRMVDDIAENFDIIFKRIGVNQQGFLDDPLNPPTQFANLPPVAQFTVGGVDGKYLVAITNPQDVNPVSVSALKLRIGQDTNRQFSPLIHELQSATTTNFDQAGGVTTYGPSSQLSWEVQDPNQTKFWRLRSSFDGQNWNRWQIFSSAQTCGPVGVYSGLLRNSANSINQAATTPTANPLTQSGTTTAITVAASVWKCGDQTISYNGGSIDPGSFGTWLIYANDPKRTGGTVPFFAVNSANQANVTADNGNLFFGKITTASSGGGTGGGGGGGTCCRAGVTYRMNDGTDRDCSLLRVGDVLMGIDGGPEVVQRIELHPSRPCFHLEFDSTGKLTKKQYIGDFTVYAVELDRTHTFLAGNSGVIDGASSTHTVQYAGGGFSDVFGIVVGEPFNLVNGAIGSHNFLKF